MNFLNLLTNIFRCTLSRTVVRPCDRKFTDLYTRTMTIDTAPQTTKLTKNHKIGVRNMRSTKGWNHSKLVTVHWPVTRSSTWNASVPANTICKICSEVAVRSFALCNEHNRFV